MADLLDEPRTPALDPVFHALADPHRRDMLRRLERGARTVGDLAAPLPISLAAASKHLQTLERAGLVRKEAVGRRRMCVLEPTALREAHAWLGRYERFWTERLDALEQRLALDASTDGVKASDAPEHDDG